MIFSDLYKSPRSPLSKLRHPHPQPSSLSVQNPGYDADLVSKDKTRQKEAVKRFLAERVRCDWEFPWPPPPPLPSPPTSAPGTGTAPPAVDAADSAASALETTGADTGISTATGAGDDAVIVAAASEPAVVDAGPTENALAPPQPDEHEGNEAGGDSGAEADSDTESVYSTVSEDPLHYRPRAEWTSDISDDDMPVPQPQSPSQTSPFRFDNPDSIGAAVQASAGARKAKRRRENREEMEWNDGLACFNARRDAWTGARTVRVKPKPASPITPVSPRRGLFRFHSHSKSLDAPAPASTSLTQTMTYPSGSPAAAPLSPVTSNSRHSQHSAPDTATTPLTSDGDSQESPSRPLTRSHPEYPVETLLPVPPPLLPPENPMRASITPAIYLSLYDKVVVHSLQPSCPINLSDMMRACVSGWKRDGEWPPRPAEPPAAAAVVVVRKKKKEEAKTKERRDSAATAGSHGRRMSFGALLGRASPEEKERDKSDEGSGGKSIRRSIQRVLGLGHHSHSTSVGSIGTGAAKEAIAGAG